MLNIESKMEIFARTYAKDTGVDVVVGKNFSTDGKKIYIVPVTDQDDPWIRMMTEVGVYHETGHIVSKDYPTFASIKDNATRHTFNVVRDVAIEKMMCDKYPGMASKWTGFLSKFIEERTNAEFANPEVKPLSKLLKLIYLRGREKQLGKDLGLVVPAPIQELFDKTVAPFMDRITTHQKVKDSLALTEDIQKAIKDVAEAEEEKEEEQQKAKLPKPPKGDPSKSDDEGEGEPSDQDGQGDQEDGEKEEGESNGEGSDASDSSGEPSDQDGSASGSGDAEEKGEEKKPSKGEASKGDASDPSDSGEPSGKTDMSDEAKEALEDMVKSLKDADFNDQTISEEARAEVNQYADAHKIYRERPGLVEDIVVPPDNAQNSGRVSDYERFGQSLLGNARGKLRTLLISEKAPVWERNLKSGKLDTRKLWKVGVGSRDVCRRKTEGIYEDAVVYEVIDNSSSMTDGYSGVTKAQIAQSVLTVVSSDLDKLRIPFGAVGFTIRRREDAGTKEGIRSEPCRLNVFKGLNEPYRRVRNRFVWPDQSQMTAELPAIKYAANQLAGRRETKKVLFILTDGETCTGSYYMDEAMRTATKEYVARLIRAGVKVVGIGILSDAMKDYCSDFICVNNLEDFGRTFYGKLTKLLL